jgi:ADP-heptose:LPS heptosyltransferase
MTLAFQIQPNVHKIAVLRANAIGDMMFSLPAFEALRAAYPRAEIVLLAQPWHARFFQARPGPIDRVVIVPRIPGVREDREAEPEASAVDLRRFFEEMQTERFDLAIQMHGGGLNSNPFLARLGARVTVGLKTPDAEPLDVWLPFYYYQSEIMRCLELVSLVGATPVVLEPRVAVLPEDIAESVRVVPLKDRPVVALHPGAGDGRRRWPTEKFAQVGDALVDAGAEVLVTGAGMEQDLIEQVLHSMHAPAQNLWGALSLRGLAGLFSRCALVVSNDSGPLHLAGAVGAATVGIYWCGNLITAGPLTRARHRPVISWRIHCPVCGNNTTEGECPHHESFVADVPVESVLQHTFDLLPGAVSQTSHNPRPA